MNLIEYQLEKMIKKYGAHLKPLTKVQEKLKSQNLIFLCININCLKWVILKLFLKCSLDF